MTITIQHLSAHYGRRLALDDVTTTVAAGKITGIIGPNGAGKSTFLKAMMGLIPHTGEVFVGEAPLAQSRKEIAYVEQRSALDLSFPINVFETVLLGTYPHLGLFKRPGKKEKQLALAALEKVGMTEYKTQQIGELSGGQLQRIFIARALAQQADVILLDEPFVGIDAVSEAVIVTLLQTLRDEGKTILIVHHDLHKVTSYFDELLILNRRLIAAGPVASVFIEENMRQAYGDAGIFIAGGVS